MVEDGFVCQEGELEWDINGDDPIIHCLKYETPFLFYKLWS